MRWAWILAVPFLAACNPTGERVVRVVVEESSGVRVYIGKDVQAQQVPCYEGSVQNNCYSISCRPVEPEPEPEPEPNASVDPAG